MHLLPPALEEKRTLIYTSMTQGVKYKRYRKEALAVGSADFSRGSTNLQREHTQQQEGKTAFSTGTQGIHSTPPLKSPGSESDPCC